MRNIETLDDLNRAAAAAGFSMAPVEDDADAPNLQTSSARGDDVARGARVPTVREALSVLPQPAERRSQPDPVKGLMAGANSVRETVFGYLGLSVTA